MKESPARVALRRIQDLVAEERGAQLGPDAERRLEQILGSLSGEPGQPSAQDRFAHRDVSILLADLRGFTSIAATYPATVVLELLNSSLAKMSETIVAHGGTIDKFMGDAIMAIFFGESEARGEDARRAVACAVDMQIAMDGLNRKHRQSGHPEMHIGIGINTGNVMAGLVGSQLYSAYTVIGEDVNLVSRIEAFSLRGQVLISESTYGYCRGFASTGEPMEVYVKGKSERVRLREVLGIPTAGKALPRQENRRSPRVQVRLPFSFHTLQSKIVMPERRNGVVLDIGYHGVLVELERELSLYAEIKLDLELPLIRYRTGDIYARVVKAFAKDGRQLAGLEFTSLDPQCNGNIQLFVQMLIQGGESAKPPAAAR